MGKHVKIDGVKILSGCLVLNNKKEILLLYKDKWKHYETPGGKVDIDECSNPENPTIEDLRKTAERELFEEVQGIIVQELEYFGNIKFKIPNGREAVAHKFLARYLSGEPKVNEPETFSKVEWISIKELTKYNLSPDLMSMSDKLKSFI